MSSDINDFMGTDERILGEWWTWGQQISRGLSQAATRVGLGIISGGFAVGSGLLYQSDAGAAWGGLALGASGLFAGAFAVSAIASGVRGR
jgi:hypothetical protein